MTARNTLTTEQTIRLSDEIRRDDVWEAINDRPPEIAAEIVEARVGFIVTPANLRGVMSALGRSFCSKKNKAHRYAEVCDRLSAIEARLDKLENVWPS